jgi:hypothetical protein
MHEYIFLCFNFPSFSLCLVCHSSTFSWLHLVLQTICLIPPKPFLMCQENLHVTLGHS